MQICTIFCAVTLSVKKRGGGSWMLWPISVAKRKWTSPLTPFNSTIKISIRHIENRGWHLNKKISSISQARLCFIHNAWCIWPGKNQVIESNCRNNTLERFSRKAGKQLCLWHISYLRTNNNISPPPMLFRIVNFHTHFPKGEELWGVFIWSKNMRIKIIFPIRWETRPFLF